MTAGPSSARGVALDALRRIDEGAYANLVLPAILDRSGLDERGRRFCTDLVYGTTRMRRACDFLVDRFLVRPEVEPDVRRALRLGAYQLHFRNLPPHAAVGATVDEVPRRARGLVNAVLRRVATAPVSWPDEATRLSYPDWIVDRLTEDLGQDDAMATLEAMNAPAVTHLREDGYVQDVASQEVAAMVDARPGLRIADVCAAPGGKATAMGGAGADVVCCDIRPSRVRLVRDNSVSTTTYDSVFPLVADARRPPLRTAAFDRVLIDAPCSGLGVLRRRPDARWRITPGDIAELVDLQREIIRSSVDLLAPGGLLVYSVCTLTDAEGPAIGRWIAREHPQLRPCAAPPVPWRPSEVGARRLPEIDGPDGMYAAVFTLPLPAAG